MLRCLTVALPISKQFIPSQEKKVPKNGLQSIGQPSSLSADGLRNIPPSPKHASASHSSHMQPQHPQQPTFPRKTTP